MKTFNPDNKPTYENERISKVRKKISRYELEGDEDRVLESEAELRALEKGEEFDREKYLEMVPRSPIVPVGRNYEYFEREDSREAIFAYSKGMAEYVFENGIKNIIFMDRAARPAWVGIDEYWNLKLKNIPKPSFYFVNPDGFTTDEFIEIANNADMIHTRRAHDQLSDSEVREQLKHKYKSLLSDKNKPILLFDTCSHSGDSLASVKRILELEGFVDVRTATATPPDKESSINSVIKFDSNHPNPCVPFGLERSIETTPQDISSSRSRDRTNGKFIRDDIRAIIREYNLIHG